MEKDPGVQLSALAVEGVPGSQWQDVCSSTMPGLMVALCRSRTVMLKQMVEAAGPALADAWTLSTVLGLRSLRLVERTLELWRRRLSVRERSLLLWYGGGRAELDPRDAFPDLQLSPGCEEFSGPLLKVFCKNKLGLHGTDNKTVYVNIVKTINGQGLLNRAASVWTDRLGEQSPQWRILYKPPIKKRTGDLQWRILHGAVALNVYLSGLDPAVSDQCPFYSGRETVFHAYSLSAGRGQRRMVSSMQQYNSTCFLVTVT
ncbi:Transposon TX1 uncharacterized 149 kDa protein ORF 2 [Takifugu flavidus]|uniref:Transposon TX1 uncharacterized 149 kDa protein ORF 2 n=1 Tax=Takifugu flavidus TaxID=433684 RepID=A0A5C6PDZ3_9TELE|nr:Transposon TX1 uncharacterized 149 kDa protein ORF 2 [Takifugu flavidus]